MWKAKAEKISPRQLFRQLKKATTTKLCKELFIQAYYIGKKALMLDDLDLVLVLITRKNGFNSIIRNFLAKQKEHLINETIKNNRKLEEPKMFYLVSKHLDCADDHQQYQGLIYVDKDFDKKDLFIKDYVEEHNVDTIQNVMDKPTYMFVRPNCRHWFVALTKNETLSCDISTLLKKYNMVDTYDKSKSKKKRFKDIIDRYNREIILYNKLNNINEHNKLHYLINHKKTMLKKAHHTYKMF